MIGGRNGTNLSTQQMACGRLQSASSRIEQIDLSKPQMFFVSTLKQCHNWTLSLGNLVRQFAVRALTVKTPRWSLCIDAAAHVRMMFVTSKITQRLWRQVDVETCRAQSEVELEWTCDIPLVAFVKDCAVGCVAMRYGRYTWRSPCPQTFCRHHVELGERTPRNNVIAEVFSEARSYATNCPYRSRRAVITSSTLRKSIRNCVSSKRATQTELDRRQRSHPSVSMSAVKSQ